MAESLSIEFLEQCLANNEYGDAVLFAALFRDRFVFDTATAQWMAFTGNYWEVDRDEQSRAGVFVDCAEQFLRLYEDMCRRKNATKDEKFWGFTKQEFDDAKRRLQRMRSVRGAEHTLRNARSLKGVGAPMVVHGGQWDADPMLLAVRNGVIDLESGAIRPGQPRDYLQWHCGCEFHGLDVPAPHFERFISEILCEDPEKIEFFHRVLGYALTGLTTEQHLFCLTGAGANGKNVLLETIHAVLGDFFWSAEPEIFLEQKLTKQPGAPNPEMASLRGRRFVSLSEIPRGRKVAMDRIKRLTGSDTITCRSPFDKYEINFLPTAKFFMSFNDRPKGLAIDFAMRRRLIYIDLPLRFVEDPEYERRQDPRNADLYRQRDPELPRKILGELPGVLAWLLRGCLKMQKYGLRPPASIRENTESIARDEDLLGRFLNDVCVTREGSQLRFQLVYEAFCKWWADEVDENDRRKPSKRWVSDCLKKRGYTVERRGGAVWAFGLDVQPLE